MKTHPETLIAVRAYSERPGRDPLGSRPPTPDDEPSEWTLVFDCETTVDAVQRLRFGFFQVRRGEKQDREGIFYDAAAVTTTELTILKAYARCQGLELMPVEDFRVKIFLKYGYVGQGTIVGFNLPFDISRIAVGHGSARREMRGGFSFDLTGKPDDPRIRVKHLSPRAALIDFGVPGEQENYRSWRNRGMRVAAYRGHFVDIKTLASALLSRRFNLQGLGAYLRTPTQKQETNEHGSITKRYLEYARADVQVTWECFRELKTRYAQHRLGKNPDRMLSEASIGKAYLQQMGIKPLLGCDPSFPRERFGEIFCAYYGGRAEVRNRRVPCEVLYCDFKSMYPTVNTHMGLWAFVVARGMTAEDTTAETQAFLERITLEDLQRPETWKKLLAVVRVKASEDVFPARKKYDGQTYTIGLNHLKSAEPLWYTLADVIVSKLLTGRCPRIEKAVTYRPGPVQDGLVPTKILGRDDFSIDPASDDFFRRLVDLRDEAKAQGSSDEKALKIIANSTSYGIFIEVNRDDAPKAEPLTVFGPNGERLKITTRAIEDPGRYFNPILGVLITGAARLMLGIAEKLTLDLGLDWAFCDTDSLAIMRPAGLSRDELHRRAQKVVDWFIPLNPYKTPGSILKIEDLNRGIGSDKMEPLYCFAISAKRYALFNFDESNRPVLRKASAHGLGHLLDPYPESDAPPDIPPNSVPLKEMGVRRWQYDFWYKIVEAALLGHAEKVLRDWHPALQRPAAIRYTASSPALLNWVSRWNEGRPYREQIRPFGFLLSFMPRTGIHAPFSPEPIDVLRPGRPPAAEAPAPIAPYDIDPTRALTKVFDRLTGKAVDPDQLKTYAEVLEWYHLSPEDKFANGDSWDQGRTERWHVVAIGLVWIGKEANRIGESGEADPIRSAVEEY
ncbi:MAG TPA: hypothetical protein VMU40_22300 [Steroidobacteraceae bacterium]|nr:hypothetical protein [Steroidobacteraceae bacterium]